MLEKLDVRNPRARLMGVRWGGYDITQCTCLKVIPPGEGALFSRKHTLVIVIDGQCSAKLETKPAPLA